MVCGIKVCYSRSIGLYNGFLLEYETLQLNHYNKVGNYYISPRNTLITIPLLLCENSYLRRYYFRDVRLDSFLERLILWL